MGQAVTPRQAKLHQRAYGLLIEVDGQLTGRRGHAVRQMECITQTAWSILPSALTCWGKVEASHVRARGAGGVNGDSGELIPQCTGCHVFYEANPQGYAMATGLDLAAESQRVKLILDERFGPEPCYQCEAVGPHALMCSTAEAIQDRREAGL